MTSPRTITPIRGVPYRIGNESTNEYGLDAIRKFIDGTGDRILNQTTFDFGMKVLALTLQGIVLADCSEPDDDGGPSIAADTYSILHSVVDTRHDREIRLVFQGGDGLTLRMGDAQTVAGLKSAIVSYRDEFLRIGDPQLWSDVDEETDEDDTSVLAPAVGQDNALTAIGERVRFWQEQDRINQELIPRVIEQARLLSQHIVEHDDLPRIVSNAVQSALEQQSQRFTDQVTQLSEEYVEQLRVATDEAVSKTQQETAETVSGLQTDLHKTRRWLAVAVGASVVLGMVALVIAVL